MACLISKCSFLHTILPSQMTNKVKKKFFSFFVVIYQCPLWTSFIFWDDITILQLFIMRKSCCISFLFIREKRERKKNIVCWNNYSWFQMYKIREAPSKFSIFLFVCCDFNFNDCLKLPLHMFFVYYHSLWGMNNNLKNQ